MLLGHGRCRFRPALDVVAQILGAVIGGWTAHLMFGLPILQSSAHARGTTGEWVGEFVATFGLIGLILSAGRHKPAALPYGIAAYISGAYRFTSSTAFANPAVTLARALTDSFARIQSCPSLRPSWLAVQRRLQRSGGCLDAGKRGLPVSPSDLTRYPPAGSLALIADMVGRQAGLIAPVHREI